MNAKHMSCSIQSGSLKIIFLLSCDSLFPDCFSCSCLCLGGCDLALSLTCLTFANVSLQRVLRWIALHVLLFKPTLGFLMADSPTPITVSTKLSLFTTLGLKSESFVHFSSALRASTLSKIVWHSIRFSTFRRAFTNSSNESSLVLVITRKLLGCIPVIFNFLVNLFSRAQTVDSTSNAVACLVVQFCSCKLPFGYRHLRVHRFVSRTPQHFCSTVED